MVQIAWRHHKHVLTPASRDTRFESRGSIARHGPQAARLQLGHQRGVDLEISGAHVQRLGAQCLQILLSAQATWLADGKTLTITEPSLELTSSVQLFGLDDPAAIFGQEQSA